MIYGRRPRQLLVVWGVSLLFAAFIYWLEFNAPVLHEIVQPFYWVVGFVALFLTWRWFRSRSKKDRRGKDRRRTDRRDHNDLRPS
jgi:membrane protein implicated in regulation of membrane protease activity